MQYRWFILIAALTTGAGCSRSTASDDVAAVAQSCQAQLVALKPTAKQCPQSTLHFHGILAGCSAAQGTFAYQYLLVNQARKDTIEKTAHWSSRVREWDQRETVPTACDDEILALDVSQVSCTCTQR